jgi:protoheme IX farnesyltransferase
VTVKETLRTYYRLTKPGIVYGNIIYVIAGFALGSLYHHDITRLPVILIATSLVIASACVVNNYIDRNIDKEMMRTKKRALVLGIILPAHAIIYAVILGSLGFALLALYINMLTFIIGILAYLFYVVVYGIVKRRSEHGTLVGSISGALPPVAGYTAITGRFDLGAVLLFIILVFWQMPHFYAIAIYRRKEYAAANVPVLTVVKSVSVAKIQMLIYVIAYTFACMALTLSGYTSWLFFGIILFGNIIWIRLAIQGIHIQDSDKWARKMFKFSLVLTLLFCFATVVDRLLF